MSVIQNLERNELINLSFFLLNNYKKCWFMFFVFKVVLLNFIPSINKLLITLKV